MTAIIRRQDWRPRLHAVIEAGRHMPFVWGHHDCATLAADAVRAMTGIDLAAGLRGSYDDARSAAAAIKAAGHASLGDLVAARLMEIAPARAMAGDLAIIRDADGLTALAVILGAEIVAAHDHGLAFVPRDRAERAFAVPFAGGVADG